MAAIRYELESKFGSTYGEDEARALIDVLEKQAPTSGNACIAFEYSVLPFIMMNARSRRSSRRIAGLNMRAPVQTGLRRSFYRCLGWA